LNTRLSRVRKGQSAVEFLSIISIALLMIIPASYLFINQTRLTGDEITSGQLDQIGNAIRDKAEEMYILGQGSWTTITINLPDSVRETYIAGEEDLVFSYDTRRGRAQAVFFMDRFSITDGTGNCDPECYLDLTPGVNEIRISSQGAGVVSIRKIN